MLTPTSLRDLLRQGGRDAIEGLLTARPDLLRPPPRTLDELCVTATHGSSLTACFAELDAFQFGVLQCLVACSDPVTVEAICVLMGDPDSDDVRRALARLEVLGLAAVRGRDVWVLPKIRALELPGFGPRAADLLDGMRVEELGRIATRLKAQPKSSRKADLLQAVLAALQDEERVRNAVAAGPEGTTALVQRIRNRPVMNVPPSYSAASKKPVTPMEWLLACGLLLPIQSYWSGIAALPLEVAIALSGGRLLEKPPSATPPVLLAEQVDDPRAEGSCIARALALVTELTELGTELTRKPAAQLASGGMGVREVRKIAKALKTDEKQLARRLELGAAAGLIALDGSARTYAPTQKYDEWAALPLAERWGRLIAVWMQMDIHLSDALTPDADGRPAPLLVHQGGMRQQVQRRALLRVLSEVSGHVEPQRLLARLGYERPGAWDDCDLANVVELVGEFEDLGLGAGPWLGPLGSCIARGAYDEAVGLLAEQAPALSSEFVISGDLTVLAAGELYPDVAAELELIADRMSGGMAKVFRLTEASLRRGFDAGRSAAEILDFLQSHSSRAIPQALDYLIRDLDRRHGQLRVGSLGSYCRYEDEALAPLLIADRRLAGFGLRVLAPGLIGANTSPEQLTRLLRDAGYLPVVEDAAGVPVPTIRAQPRVQSRGTRQTSVAATWPDVADLADQLASGKTVSLPVNVAGSSSWCRECEAFHSDDELDDLDEFPRPEHVAHHPDEITALLGVALDTDFAVCLSSGGNEHSAWVEALSARKVRLLLEDGSSRTVPIASIEWVRVLEEDEEFALLG